VTEPLLQIRGLTKRFGGVIAADEIGLDIARDEFHAVIGPNGAGKTTLIGLLAGEIVPQGGSVRFDGSDIAGLSVDRRSRLGLARSFQITSLFSGFTALDNVALAVQSHSGHSFRFWRDARREASLLDEPMAGLGPDESARMVEMLRKLKGAMTILLIEHDMETVFALADRVTVLVYGRVIASGDPAAIRADPAVREAYLGEQEPRAHD